MTKSDILYYWFHSLCLLGFILFLFVFQRCKHNFQRKFLGYPMSGWDDENSGRALPESYIKTYYRWGMEYTYSEDNGLCSLLIAFVSSNNLLMGMIYPFMYYLKNKALHLRSKINYLLFHQWIFTQRAIVI